MWVQTLSQASHCFHEQETLHSLLSTGWFQERIHTGWFQERIQSVSISLYLPTQSN
jgi:hypothetical protein